LARGEEVATCPSCSLLVRVVYDMVRFPLSTPFLASGKTGIANADQVLAVHRWITKMRRTTSEGLVRINTFEKGKRVARREYKVNMFIRSWRGIVCESAVALLSRMGEETGGIEQTIVKFDR